MKDGRKPYDPDKLFLEAVKLIKKNKFMFFDCHVYGMLGISDGYYYRKILRDPEKREEIKRLLMKNRMKKTTQKLEQLDKKTDTAAIIAFAKVSGIEVSKRLSTQIEEKIEIPIKDVNKDGLLTRLDALDE